MGLSTFFLWVSAQRMGPAFVPVLMRRSERDVPRER